MLGGGPAVRWHVRATQGQRRVRCPSAGESGSFRGAVRLVAALPRSKGILAAFENSAGVGRNIAVLESADGLDACPVCIGVMTWRH